MTNVIIIGHGGYGSAMRRNLAMLVGELEEFFYIDFDEQDDLEILREKIAGVIAPLEGNDILFCCDVSGGSPFREAAIACTQRENCVCIAGVNTSAYSEISFNLELPASELADMAIEVARSTMIRFPEAEG